MATQFLDKLKTRRTQYALGKDLPLGKDEVTTLIEEAIKHSPSSFNSQSSRAVILFGEESVKFWNIAKEELRKIVPADSFASTEQRIDSFAAGAGTVLFYEDQEVIKGLQEKFALYADKFPIWSEHSTGMAQLSVWTALADANIGASLQHYNPLVDAEAAKTWGVPDSWVLHAMMPFGAHKGEFGEKSFMDDADRFKVFG